MVLASTRFEIEGKEWEAVGQAWDNRLEKVEIMFFGEKGKNYECWLKFRNKY